VIEMDEYKLRIYNSKTNKEMKDRTNKVISDLSLFGRSISDINKNTNSKISRRFGIAVKDGIVHFTWNRYHNKSVVTLDTGYELIRDGQQHIKIRRR
jgi:hypothetical protein